MRRNEFLQGLGLAGVGTFLTPTAIAAARKMKPVSPPPSTCVLIPTETAGPFPLDLTENPAYFRQDVREDRAGVQLNLKLKITGTDNCGPMPNIRVNIWHCDKDGNYSGYGTEVGQTYLRGYQLSDANGEVEFITIFPGWYNGRICHIHFQCYVSSVYAAISQLSFPIDVKNAIYAANPTIYTKGADPLTFSQDNVFADGYAYQLATLTPNTDTGGYDASMEVTIEGAGTTGLAVLEPETGGQFKLGQNFPNPYQEETTVPFTLTQSALVQLDLFDLEGKRVATVSKGTLAAGAQQVDLHMKDLGLTSGNYVYQLQVVNDAGTFRQCKLMTAFR